MCKLQTGDCRNLAFLYLTDTLAHAHCSMTEPSRLTTRVDKDEDNTCTVTVDGADMLRPFASSHYTILNMYFTFCCMHSH